MISKLYFQVKNDDYILNIEDFKEIFKDDNRMKCISYLKNRNGFKIFIDFYIDLTKDLFNKYANNIKTKLNINDVIISYEFKRLRKKQPLIFTS